MNDCVVVGVVVQVETIVNEKGSVLPCSLRRRIIMHSNLIIIDIIHVTTSSYYDHTILHRHVTLILFWATFISNNELAAEMFKVLQILKHKIAHASCS